MKKLLLCVMLCTFMMTLATSAQAQRRGSAAKASYIGLEAGLFLPSESDLDSGFDVGAKFIHYFNENIGVNGILSYRSFGGEYDGYLSKVELDITTISLAGGVSGRYPLNNTFYLVGDAGIAYHMNTAKLTMKLFGHTVSEDDDENKIGFYLNGGANFHVTPDVSVGGLIRYTINDAYDDFDLGGISILLTLGYMF